MDDDSSHYVHNMYFYYIDMSAGVLRTCLNQLSSTLSSEHLHGDNKYMHTQATAHH